MTSEARATFGSTALLAPALPDDFFRGHWERKPLHLARGDPHYYDGVLTNGDWERILSSADLRYPAIQLARNGAYLAPDTKNIKHGSGLRNNSCRSEAQASLAFGQRPRRLSLTGFHELCRRSGCKTTVWRLSKDRERMPH